jgi:hypothetical protein
VVIGFRLLARNLAIGLQITRPKAGLRSSGNRSPSERSTSTGWARLSSRAPAPTPTTVL